MVETISEEDSAAYFRTRPRESRISAWASPQSEPLDGREELEARVAEVQRRFEDVDDVPLPPFWGGYRIVASVIEFWQGRPNRLHDRVRYELADGRWRRERLAP
jgi:pyridoxamine 5'-phosphate oxidase